MSTIVDLDELGRRIRGLRTERRMTLKQVEEIAGLSATHLSEIERGRTSPTVGALLRIARALDRDASYFIELEERSDVAHVVREDDASRREGKGADRRLLSPGIPGSALFPYRIRLKAQGTLSVPASDLPRDIILHVQKGGATVKLGGRTWTIASGDTMQASRPDAISLKAADSATELLLVCTRELEIAR